MIAGEALTSMISTQKIDTYCNCLMLNGEVD